MMKSVVVALTLSACASIVLPSSAAAQVAAIWIYAAACPRRGSGNHGDRCL